MRHVRNLIVSTDLVSRKDLADIIGVPEYSIYKYLKKTKRVKASYAYYYNRNDAIEELTHTFASPSLRDKYKYENGLLDTLDINVKYGVARYNVTNIAKRFNLKNYGNQKYPLYKPEAFEEALKKYYELNEKCVREQVTLSVSLDKDMSLKVRDISVKKNCTISHIINLALYLLEDEDYIDKKSFINLLGETNELSSKKD
jgi:hypothetical protein